MNPDRRSLRAVTPVSGRIGDPRDTDPFFGTDFVIPRRRRVAIGHWLLNDLPYIVILLLALGGVSWATFANQPVVTYWVFLSPVFGAICVFEGWRRVTTREDHLRLVYTQFLSWAGVLTAMYLSLLPVVGAVVNDDATGIALLTILALGTFMAGLQARVWRVCVVGLFLAISVPAIAWLDRSALFLTFTGLLMLLVVGSGVVWRLFRR
jgi:hypothetical protein